MIVAIHQPNFIPWLGYFLKIARANKFVFLDTVQYTKNSFINRNRIKTQSGAAWLTVPVRAKGRFGQPICEVEIVWEEDWRQKHLQTLVTNYRRAPYFSEVFPLLESLYGSVRQDTTLSEFNISIIQAISEHLGLRPTMLRVTNLMVEGKGTDLLVSICQKLQASVYLAGGGATKYQDNQKFLAAGIQIEYSDFKSMPYVQQGGDFVENLSIVDGLMNCGRSIINLICPPLSG
jgi:hypothetical protein